MISCQFEDGKQTHLRHVTTDLIGICDAKVLLVRRAPHLVEGDKWALPGGYMDLDENIEVTAPREFLEETGHECTNLTLFDIDSRAKRPGNERQNVTFIYAAYVGEQIAQPDDESTDMRWFALDELPQSSEIAFGHDRYIKNFARYLQQSFPLPLLNGEVLVNGLHPSH